MCHIIESSPIQTKPNPIQPPSYTIYRHDSQRGVRTNNNNSKIYVFIKWPCFYYLLRMAAFGACTFALWRVASLLTLMTRTIVNAASDVEETHRSCPEEHWHCIRVPLIIHRAAPSFYKMHPAISDRRIVRFWRVFAISLILHKNSNPTQQKKSKS